MDIGKRFRELSGLRRFSCENYDFVGECVILIQKLKTKYPRLTCVYHEGALCGDGYNCHSSDSVTFKLADDVTLSIDDHVNIDQYHLQLSIKGRLYCNWKTIPCFGCNIRYYERVVMKSKDILKLTFDLSLEASYNEPREGVKILDENNSVLARRSTATNFVTKTISLPKTTLVSETSKSYADIARTRH